MISVTNATGDMYNSNNNVLLTAENQTTGFTRPDASKLFNETTVSGVQELIHLKETGVHQELLRL